MGFSEEKRERERIKGGVEEGGEVERTGGMEGGGKGGRVGGREEEREGRR